MFENVLVGVDGSANGRDAVALALQLVSRDGRVTLARVHSEMSRPSVAVTPGLAGDKAIASLALLRRERAATGVAAALASITATSPARGLHEQAARMGADLIVVGSTGRGLLRRALAGDDARAVLGGAGCAAAVAARAYAAHAAPLARIGVGYDESAESEAALAVARELAAESGARVEALEVVTPLAYGGFAPEVVDTTSEMVEAAETHLDELADVRGRVVCGPSGEELTAFSRGVDLLVVGTRGHGPARRLLLGSTSRYLERHARCSLLVVPRPSAAHEPDAVPAVATSS